MARIKHGAYPKEGGKPLGKSAVCALYQMEFPQMDVRPLFSVLAAHKEYRQFMAHWQEHETREYMDLLKRIEQHSGDAIEFLQANYDFLSFAENVE